MDIFTYDEKTGATKQLTTAKGYDAEGGYSPDGQWIAFSSMRDAYNRTLSAAEQKQLELDPSYFAEVYIMKADGSGQKRLTTENGYDGGTFFTKDGRIVWRHFDENGLIANVWTMKPDGTDKKQITDFGSMSWAPYEHPSGEYFLFASNKLGFENFEVFMVDKAGLKEPVRITYTDGFDGLPVPSPDGTQLAWTSSRAGGTGAAGQIYLAQWNHEAAMAALKAAGPRQTSEEIDPLITNGPRRHGNTELLFMFHRQRLLSRLRHRACSPVPQLFRRQQHRLGRRRMCRRWRRTSSKGG